MTSLLIFTTSTCSSEMLIGQLLTLVVTVHGFNLVEHKNAVTSRRGHTNNFTIRVPAKPAVHATKNIFDKTNNSSASNHTNPGTAGQTNDGKYSITNVEGQKKTFVGARSLRIDQPNIDGVGNGKTKTKGIRQLPVANRALYKKSPLFTYGYGNTPFSNSEASFNGPAVQNVPFPPFTGSNPQGRQGISMPPGFGNTFTPPGLLPQKPAYWQEAPWNPPPPPPPLNPVTENYNQIPITGPPYHSGVYNPKPYNQGPSNQGPYNQGPYNQGPYNQGPFNQGPFNQPLNSPNQPWKIFARSNGGNGKIRPAKLEMFGVYTSPTGTHRRVHYSSHYQSSDFGPMKDMPQLEIESFKTDPFNTGAFGELTLEQPKLDFFFGNAPWKLGRFSLPQLPDLPSLEELTPPLLF